MNIQTRTDAPLVLSGRDVTAVLGPTNTGKTHFAMDRLLGHESGIIGFPLRLLARENYDRAVAAKGKHAVALVTGESSAGQLLNFTAGGFIYVATVDLLPELLKHGSAAQALKEAAALSAGVGLMLAVSLCE